MLGDLGSRFRVCLWFLVLEWVDDDLVFVDEMEEVEMGRGSDYYQEFAGIEFKELKEIKHISPTVLEDYENGV